MNPYKVLGLSTTSDYITVRKRYIELAKKHHPDNFATSKKVSEEKMKKINNAFNIIKETVHHKIIHFHYKGKFTQAEVNEVVSRFNKGQSLNKISRDMDRSREAIRKYLIKLGHIPEPIKREKVDISSKWYDVITPSFHTCLFVFMTISMILSFPTMACMSLALIFFISD